MVGRSRRFKFSQSAVAAVLAVAGLSSASVASAQIQQQIDRCDGKDSVTSQLKISSCTAVIGAGTFTGKDLAFAFNNRGSAYYADRDYDRAIADYNAAIKLKPDDALSFGNRGIAYFTKQDYDRAAADFTEFASIRLICVAQKSTDFH